jgi:hypothetical protein
VPFAALQGSAFQASVNVNFGLEAGCAAAINPHRELLPSPCDADGSPRPILSRKPMFHGGKKLLKF